MKDNFENGLNEFNMSLDKFYNNLIEEVIEILSDVLVDQYNILKEDGHINGETFDDRIREFTFYVQSANYVNELFATYPVLEDMLHTMLSDYISSVNEIVEEYYSEKDKISDYFSTFFGEIISIKFNLGDKHNGKSVAKVHFENGILYYKPKKLLTDELYNELLLFMEEYQITDFKKINTYVSSSHSWQEEVSYNPNLTKEESNRYYYRAGVILSILYCMRGTDIHYENIIVSGEYPIIIDTETLTSPSDMSSLDESNGKSINQSILGSAMLPLKDKLYDVNVSGLFPENNVSETIFYYSIVEDEERDFVYKKNAAETNIGSNGVYVDGKLITAKDVKTHLIAGFESGAKNILNNKEEFIKIISSSKYNKMSVRKILRGTQVYYTFIRESKNPSILKSRKKYDRIFNILLKTFIPSTFGYLRVEEEIKGLKKMDIPCFYTDFHGTNLYSNNEVICENYFSTSSFENVLHAVKSLDKDMIRYQKHLINLGLFVANTNENDLNNTITRRNYNNLQEYNIVEFPHELLNHEVIEYDEESSFFYLANFDDRDLIIDVINSGLYMGGGIVHYLYTYAFIKKDVKIKAFSKRLINGLYKQYRSVNKGDFKNYFSVYEGCGGFIYLSYNYSKLFSDEGIGNKFYYVLNDVLNYYNENEFDKDLDKDFINGFGSTVLLLSRLYLETGIKVSYKERIKLLLENYYDFLRKSDFIEIGLAHGISGVCLNLSFIYRITERSDILSFMHELSITEDHMILKESKTISYTWCRGITGVLLSRNIIYDNIVSVGNIKQFSSILNYLEKMLKHYGSKSNLKKMLSVSGICLCHGIAGNIDSLAGIKKLFHIKEHSNIHYEFPLKESVDSYEWFVGSDYSFESFMLGKSGVLYSLLHKDNKIPSVTALDLF